MSTRRLGVLRKFALCFATLGQVLVAAWHGPYKWMIPFVALLLVLAVVFVVVQVLPATAPFVYAMF
jgi:hypothetical protein